MTAAEIAQSLGIYGAIENVLANWPIVEAALESDEILDEATAIAAIATIVTETGNFSPVKERGGPQYLTKLYENRKDLGNTEPGDGAKFRGRGFIQITGRWDYDHFGKEIGQDLVANPDLALAPATAAAIFAAFFRDRGIPAMARLGEWEMVRRRVDGGMNGWPRFSTAVAALRAALLASTTSP
ncbi:MAG: glycoside hydrolase family 19 protein [Candidatus Acidiferrales bacterium]